jgi:hypothetical protein
MIETIHNRSILTDRGMILENNIFQGDKVYDYITNSWVEVKDIEYKSFKRLFIVHYNDGRIQYITENEEIRIGDYHKFPYEINKSDLFVNKVNVHAIDFYTKIRNKLDPNPYIAGALLMHGDYNSEYVNIHYQCIDAINAICNEYHYKYDLDPSDSSKVLFSYNPILTLDYITWNDFFKKYEFFARNKNIDDPAFPKEYMYGSIEDRIQFIRGAFDAGYNKEDSPDNVALNHWDCERIQWLQWILWSLGICSEITTLSTESKYRLDILTDRIWCPPISKVNSYPGFFYDNLYIRNMIDVDNRIYQDKPQFNLSIDMIEEVKNPFRNELIPKFIFDKNVIAVDKSFLPKVII